ncbi:MAG: hypothetical protein LWY06_14995 [Firmicutes bacterium]|nr:hypothetical protein [Bacillota bacterium]
MASTNRTMMTIDEDEKKLREEYINLLGHIAAVSFITVIIFTISYILLPEGIQDFEGIRLKIPFISWINFMLLIVVSSISNWFTYFFLVAVGVLSIVAANRLEDQILIVEKKPAPAKKSTDGIEVVAKDVQPAKGRETAGKTTKNIFSDLSDDEIVKQEEKKPESPRVGDIK